MLSEISGNSLLGAMYTAVPSFSVKRNLVASGASNVRGPYLISSGRLGTLVPTVCCAAKSGSAIEASTSVAIVVFIVLFPFIKLKVFSLK